MRKPRIFLLLILAFSLQRSDAAVVFNEFMSNNQGTVTDSDGDYSDWIELYNTSATPVNLLNWGLSDNVDSLFKWRFPNYTLNAGSFLRIWCSGKNRAVSTPFHTSFSIDSRGETIYLSDSSGAVQDNLLAIYMPPDRSFGRLPNGSVNQFYLSVATPAASNNFATAFQGAVTEPVTFSLAGGFYPSAQTFTLSHPDPTVTIRYTLDGSEPTANSTPYTGPITVDSRAADTNFYSTIRTCYKVHAWLPDWNPPLGNVYKCNVVRARAFKSSFLPGPVSTQSYFIDPAMATRYGSLPVVSLVSDPRNLFNDTVGIYVPGINYVPNTFQANYYFDWNRQANVEFFMPGGQQVVNSNFRISINGVTSRSSPQKGLDVTATTDLGEGKIRYPFFANTPGPARYLTSFDKLKLRSWGSDRAFALFRDAYTAQFFHKTTLDYEAYRPCVVFIDGEYWGLHELRERNRNEEYFEDHYLIDKDNPGFDIVDLQDNIAIEGDTLAWSQLEQFVTTNNMADSANYAYVKTKMDVENFMLNYVSSIYFSRGDWPGQNEAVWRPRTPDGKFKWIQWDMDNTTAYYLNPWYDMFQQAILGSRGYGPSPMLVALLANTGFRDNWINLFADYMNTNFLPALMQAKVDELRNELSPYMQEYRDRWQCNANWQAQTDSMKWWVNLRQQFCRQQILTTFSLPAFRRVSLNVSDTAKGNIRVNTVFLDPSTPRTTTNVFPWAGYYFQGVPVPLTAVPKPGYRFVRWLQSNDTNATIQLNLVSDTVLTALFDVDTSYRAPLRVVINEAQASNNFTVQDNYGEYDDWLEIYNPNADTVDLAGYYVTDNLILPTRFQFPVGNDSTKIAPYGHLLLWADDDAEQGALHLPFKFNASGDLVVLYRPDASSVEDSIRLPSILSDQSYGRSYDASSTWVFFTTPTPAATNQEIPAASLLINEVMASNTGTIADNYGQFDDWFELYNPTADTLDLAGWFASDDPAHPTRYRFPHGTDSTKVPPYGFRIVWADGQPEQGVLHATFGLSASGDCVYLYKPDAITISDNICIGAAVANVSYGRTYDGANNWIDFNPATPGATNVQVGAERIVINEVLTVNTNSVTDNFGEREPWIELHNPNPDTVDLGGWFLFNLVGNPGQFRFPFDNDSLRIPPGGFLLVYADNETRQGSLHVPFQLNGGPACIWLYKPDQAGSDSICFGAIAADQSYGRQFDDDPVWINFPVPTPGATNYSPQAATALLNEVQPVNTNSAADNYGDFDPWVEIYNPNPDTLDLGGWYISDVSSQPLKHRFPLNNDSLRIPPGGLFLVWSDNEVVEGAAHANFILSNGPACVYLTKPDGLTRSDSLCYPLLAADESYGRRADGDPVLVTFTGPTPGGTNWNFTPVNVLINEVQPVNLSTIADEQGEFDAWVELYNPFPDTIDLAGWYMANTATLGNPVTWYRFPFDNDSTKIPGDGFRLLWADAAPGQGALHLWFVLNGLNDCVYLIKPDENVSDQICYTNVQPDHSYGRDGDGDPDWRDFSIPTPDSTNVDLSVGLPNAPVAKQLLVWPNPVHDGQIFFSRSIDASLFDQTGRMLRFTEGQTSMDLQGLASGVYVLLARTGERIRIVVY